MQLAVTVTQGPDDAVRSNPLPSHRELVARIAADRDREAFRTLFEQFGPRIKTLMMKAGADHALAEDLVQDVMMTVWRKVELYRPERGAVSTWIYTIARNARIDRLRHHSSRPYEDISDLELPSDEPDGEAAVYASQQAEKVGAALAGLPDDQRQIIEMAYLQDMSQSEIAERLSVPLGTVKSRMRLAYRKLQATLESLV
jgi:RNA polymerase sigma-70 factor (ECF subfamily)